MRDKIHSIMDFEFRMDKIQNMHFHQTPEIVYAHYLSSLISFKELRYNRNVHGSGDSQSNSVYSS